MIELKHIERFYPLAKGQFSYVLRDVNLKIEVSVLEATTNVGKGVRAYYRHLAALLLS